MENEKMNPGTNDQDWQSILNNALADTHTDEQDDELDAMLRDFETILSTGRERRASAQAAPQPKTAIPSAYEEDVLPVRPRQRVQQAPARVSTPAPQAPVRREPRPASRRQSAAAARKSRLHLLLFLWLDLFLSSTLVRACTIDGFWRAGLFLSILFSLTPALLVFTLSTFSHSRKVNKGIVIGYTALVFALYVSQMIYYKVFQQFYSAMSMTNAGQGLSFLDTLMANVLKSLPIIILLLLPLLFVCIFGSHFFSFKGVRSWTRTGVLCVLMVVLHFFTVLILPLWGSDKMTPYDMYHHRYDVKESTKTLGLGTAFRLDLKWFIFGGGEAELDLDLDPDTDDTDPAETAPAQTDENGQTIPTESTGETAPAPTEYGYNVLNIDFDTLAAGEGDSDIREMYAYFDSIKPSKKNEYTGIFEGCNLILLTCESFDYLAIDPVLTPTLYKMQHEGIYFTNFYTPVWGVSTTDGEYAHLLGTIPEAGVWSFYRTGEYENYLPLTMCAQLKNLGYCAYAYHNHTYSYYDRDLSHPNMGYIYKGLGNGIEDMGVKEQWPESDMEMIAGTTEEYIHQQPFHAYYMTVSGHQYYNFQGNKMAIKHMDEVADLPYSETVRAYLATQMELDQALELLLQRLEEAGVADNTVIALSADHWPYGLSQEELSELAGHPVEETFETHKNACIIYKKGMTPVTVDEPCCSLDVLPTLSNLFGLEFDSRLYMGRDVFSGASPLVIFVDRSWITDKCSYNSSTGEVISFTGEEISDEYISKIKKTVSNKFTISARILEDDFWRVLFKPDN